MGLPVSPVSRLTRTPINLSPNSKARYLRMRFVM
jgi:hypothetical protein